LPDLLNEPLVLLDGSPTESDDVNESDPGLPHAEPSPDAHDPSTTETHDAPSELVGSLPTLADLGSALVDFVKAEGQDPTPIAESTPDQDDTDIVCRELAVDADVGSLGTAANTADGEEPTPPSEVVGSPDVDLAGSGELVSEEVSGRPSGGDELFPRERSTFAGLPEDFAICETVSWHLGLDEPPEDSPAFVEEPPSSPERTSSGRLYTAEAVRSVLCELLPNLCDALVEGIERSQHWETASPREPPVIAVPEAPLQEDPGKLDALGDREASAGA
jgi:hypothetical protein